MNTQQEMNEKEWENAQNWTMPIGFYFSKKDSRWIVPRRIKWMGWTFNIAHQMGALAMLIAMILPVIFIIGVLVFTIARHN